MLQTNVTEGNRRSLSQERESQEMQWWKMDREVQVEGW